MERIPRASVLPFAWAFVTDRTGGVSVGPYDSLNLAVHVGDHADAVARNRAVAAERAGVTVDRLAFMSPNHGAEVAVVTPANVGSVPIADVLLTTTPGLALAALAADCVPVVAASASGGAVVAAHIGWRGVVAGTALAAVRALVEAAPGEEIAVHLGPAICPGCYEVSEELRSDIAAVVPAAATATRIGTPAVDVAGAVREQLRAAGISRVTSDGRCTAQAPELYSYRRDAITGRHAAIVRCGAVA